MNISRTQHAIQMLKISWEWEQKKGCIFSDVLKEADTKLLKFSDFMETFIYKQIQSIHFQGVKTEQSSMKLW